MGTLSDKLKEITTKLTAIYPPVEAENLALLLMEDQGILRTDVRLNADKSIDEVILANQLSRLLTHEPIQHILGKAHFYGFDVKVTPYTLIPRRETEELVHLVLKEYANQSPKVLDIGTGSGIIPISIKHELNNAEVWAMDISKEALEVAKENTRTILGEGKVTFVQDDILNPQLKEEFDVIISNPPYVTEAEKKEMNKNVLDFDPHLALFVPDEDPLKFYKAVAEFSSVHLKQGGKLYVEINEAFGPETAHLFEQHGLKDTQIIKDMQGKSRIVTAIK